MISLTTDDTETQRETTLDHGSRMKIENNFGTGMKKEIGKISSVTLCPLW